MEKFILVLGKESSVLSGKIWTQYDVEIAENEMICTMKKDATNKVIISFSDFKEAEFGIGSGNLWLQCKIGDGSLNFCSPRKIWKSEQGKLLIERISSVIEIKDMKAYKSYTGPFFIFKIFK